MFIESERQLISFRSFSTGLLYFELELLLELELEWAVSAQTLIIYMLSVNAILVGHS